MPKMTDHEGRGKANLEVCPREHRETFIWRFRKLPPVGARWFYLCFVG